MKVIVAGTRTFDDPKIVEECLKRIDFPISEIVSGGCRGIDSLAINWALSHNVPYTVFKADWGKYGKRAGPIRNQEMVNYADAIVAIWDGSSRGTKDVINKAKNKGLKINLFEEVTQEDS